MKLIHIEEPEHKEEISNKKAEEILKIKPDAILFEYPVPERNSLSDFNNFSPKEKPKQRIDAWKKSYAKYSEKYHWLKSEYKIIEAIEQLWNEEKQTYLFEIDGPIGLTSIGETKDSLKGLQIIVWNYIREKFMAENIRNIESFLDKKAGKEGVVLIFCHDTHWKNIRFLLKNPSKNEIQKYYFSRRGIKSIKEIESELKEKNMLLYQFWKLKSDFK